MAAEKCATKLKWRHNERPQIAIWLDYKCKNRNDTDWILPVNFIIVIMRL